MMDVGRHPNIKLLTFSEILSLEGKAGNFKAKILRKPRYVDEELCNGCGICAENCSRVVPNEFDEGLHARKAIHIPFAQAVPKIYTIDRKNCINANYDFIACQRCANACEIKAINHDAQPKEIEVDVGSVIVTTGFDLYDPRGLTHYGYRKYENVMTNLELERLLNASGPTGGHILRPTDKKVPKRIAFIQCVGSRGEANHQYCSRYCCLNTIKDAMLIKQHDPEIEEMHIFFIDMHACGKGFEDFYKRAQGMDFIKFIRGKPSSITEINKNGDLEIRVEDTETGEIKNLEFDLAVLSPAILPPNGSKELANILGIDLDASGFLKHDEDGWNFLQTTRKGIYAAGCALGPADISESVAQASGAAIQAGKWVVDFKIKPEDENIESIDTSGDARVGVFVCHCGINIAGVVDVEKLFDYAATLPGVAHVQRDIFLCSSGSQKDLQKIIQEKNLNRIVAAACTPRTHEPIFRETMMRMGMNPFMLEMVNIRDQCSWVHSEQPELATWKAQDLLRMAVARVKRHSELVPEEIKMEQSVLVIGGGIAGIQSALDLDAQGYKVTIVEKTDKLGGMLSELHKLYPNNAKASELLKRKLKLLSQSEIDVRLRTEVDKIDGFVGNFDVELSDGDLRVGAIILATGAALYDPTGEFGYGEYENVLTNMELEQLLKSAKNLKINGRKPGTVAFVQCVGSRDEKKSRECSRYCCSTSIKQAIALREMDIEAVVYYRDIRTVSHLSEELYRKAREMGVRFIHFTDDSPPEIHGNTNAEIIEHLEPSLKLKIELPVDAVVLAVAMIPNELEAGKLHELVKIPRGPAGFFMERHPKLDPVGTTTEGVFLAGTVHGPKDIADSIVQGAAAAAKALNLIGRGSIMLDPTTCMVRIDYCRACGRCVDICEFSAPEIIQIEPDVHAARINQALCKGCGTCASWCPTGAIVANHFTDRQVDAMLESLLLEEIDRPI
ncbi:CoB--CoM heterodisulfide reductase iron-sulfur subunit A family protein [bacterium]|nr:CoB--CoM heterodisulfide reductase iron-sulfur subunit A family protein [bacterium]MBU1025012.1 CoB--CoM heterodisulfide reductase iron-sulfur subunit A family protein [bacterium]